MAPLLARRWWSVRQWWVGGATSSRFHQRRAATSPHTAEELRDLDADSFISQLPLQRLPRRMPTFLAWQMWHMVRVHTAIMTRHTIIPTDTIIVASAIWHRHGLSLLSTLCPCSPPNLD